MCLDNEPSDINFNVRETLPQQNYINVACENDCRALGGQTGSTVILTAEVSGSVYLMDGIFYSTERLTLTYDLPVHLNSCKCWFYYQGRRFLVNTWRVWNFWSRKCLVWRVPRSFQSKTLSVLLALVDHYVATIWISRTGRCQPFFEFFGQWWAANRNPETAFS